MHKSYRASMSIERPETVSEAEGAFYIQHWANGVVSDLFSDLSNSDALYALPALARKAHRWFEDAWQRAGDLERRFPINWFVIELFEESGHQGRLLADINVLNGTFRELS